jgi:hypothetical protein
MPLNLHGLVAPAIDALNPRFSGVWRRSNGYTTGTDGTQVPAYANTTVMMRVQALSGRDLQHEAFLNVQGVKRVVSMFSNAQGVNKPDVKGGDILQFPENRGGSNRDWLIVGVLETWTPDASGWCRVGVVLQ